MATAKKKARSAPAAKRGAKLNLVKNGSGATDPHKFGKDCQFRSRTEQRGHPTPRGRHPLRIVVDASEGFIPLWAQDVVLRWRFHEESM